MTLSVYSQVDLPLIDISEFPQDLDGVDVKQLADHPQLAKTSKACKEWGFFQVVNHGIPADVLETAENVCRDLLSHPTEAKNRASVTGNSTTTYLRNANFESFRFPDSTDPAAVEELCSQIWPEGDALIFGKTMAAYASSVSNLAQVITKIVIASLGLDVEAFYRSHFEKSTAVMRINGYPSDNIDIGEEALVHHTDLNFLTILYQDDVGGLQIRSREGEWFNVKPLPHSFVVNVGDSLKAWSNGRYRSAEHRVVYNGWKDRLSIAFFNFLPEDTEIWAPEELVDSDNPRRYKPFIFSHFRHAVTSSLTVNQYKEKPMALEKFAGI